jgi:WD40 repeat protein
VQCASFNHDGRQVVAGSADGVVALWDAVTGKRIRELKCPHPPNQVVFSPGDDLVLARCGENDDDREVLLWAIGKPASDPLVLKHAMAVQEASFSRDGRYVVTACGGHLGLRGDGEARIWDATDGSLRRVLHSQYSVRSACFSPDAGSVLLAIGNMGMVTFGETQLWSWMHGDEEPVWIDKRESVVTHLDVDGKGERVLTANMVGFVRVLGGQSGRELWSQKQSNTPVRQASFSRDGARVLTVSGDIVRVLEAATGEEISVMRHSGAVEEARLDPTGDLVLSACGNTAWIWDASAGQPLTVLKHRDAVTHVEFSPDGRSVLTASKDSTARLLDMGVDDSTSGDLALRARLLCANRIDDSGRIVPMDLSSFRSTWEALRAKR